MSKILLPRTCWYRASSNSPRAAKWRANCCSSVNAQIQSIPHRDVMRMRSSNMGDEQDRIADGGGQTLNSAEAESECVDLVE
ncbi:hypothetical protein [Rhodococcus sp. ARC_M6]|uniref:hypothetical protein n=1 Tax=Rhodococcus sp. ARC_M6 TaxID=2928852 RepID=UPI001FB4BDE7|nr:hypothetical protein [Rhodococcus sp. ARC_M6]MCJ0906505.1 hypothetical protein [Rhodococcus sp. ARC_M6]